MKYLFVVGILETLWHESNDISFSAGKQDSEPFLSLPSLKQIIKEKGRAHLGDGGHSIELPGPQEDMT